MDRMLLIITSLKKQRLRGFLIFIQLFIAFFSITIAVLGIETTFDQVNKMKSICSTDVISIHISNFIGGYGPHTYLKNEDFLAIGSMTNAKIVSDNLNDVDLKNIKPDPVFVNIQTILMDTQLTDIFNIKFNNGKNFNSINTSVHDTKTIPAIVGRDMIKDLPIGSKKNIVISNYKSIIMEVVGIIDNNQYFPEIKGIESGLYTSSEIQSLNNTIIAVLPEVETPLYLSLPDTSVLIKGRENTTTIDNINKINSEFKKMNITQGHVRDVNDEINAYITANKPKIYISIAIGTLIFLLSTFGIIGVVLSSILRRKKELGVRYSLGCSPIGLMVQVVSEIFILYIAADIAGNIFAFIVSSSIGEMHIGIVTILTTAALMIFLCTISTVLPAIKIIRTQPIDLIKEGSK